MIVTQTKSKYSPFTHIRGVHVLPVILTKEQIADIYKVSEIKAHHDEGHGGGGHHRGVKREKITLFKADKPYNFPEIAESIYKNIPRIVAKHGSKDVAVDPAMQVYTLPRRGRGSPCSCGQGF